jgi:hypothetical protein
MLRMSPLRGDRTVATLALPVCPAARNETLSPLARAGALGGLLFAGAARYARQGLAGPGPATFCYVGWCYLRCAFVLCTEVLMN